MKQVTYSKIDYFRFDINFLTWPLVISYMLCRRMDDNYLLSWQEGKRSVPYGDMGWLEPFNGPFSSLLISYLLLLRTFLAPNFEVFKQERKKLWKARKQSEKSQNWAQTNGLKYFATCLRAIWNLSQCSSINKTLFKYHWNVRHTKHTKDLRTSAFLWSRG